MSIGRFQVMAVLQAARAYLLGLPLVSAKSWGIQRAIFYAAAKKGFVKPKGVAEVKEVKLSGRSIDEKMQKEIIKSFQIFNLGDEMAYSVKIANKVYFVIGNEIQTEENFKKQVEEKFGKVFNRVWEDAIKICRSFDEGVLKSQRYFFEAVYKPHRDELVSKWSSWLNKK